MIESNIKIYNFDFRQLNNKIESLHKNLTSEELIRSEEKLTKEIQVKSQLSRGILREILSKNLGCSAKDLKIQRGHEGKIYLPDYPELHFNVSHSKNLIIIALSKNEIGIDIEFNKAKFNASTIKSFMSKQEADKFANLPTSLEQQEYFFLIWTAKEAIAKYYGQGLKMDFSGLTIYKTDDVNFTSSNSSIHGQYVPIGPDYTLALCQKEALINYEIIS